MAHLCFKNYFLKVVTPYFRASALAEAAQEFILLIRVLLAGCVLKNSGGAPCCCACIRSQSCAATIGSYPAIAISVNPILSASVSWLLLKGNITPTLEPKPYAVLNNAWFSGFSARAIFPATAPNC